MGADRGADRVKTTAYPEGAQVGAVLCRIEVGSEWPYRRHALGGGFRGVGSALCGFGGGGLAGTLCVRSGAKLVSVLLLKVGQLALCAGPGPPLPWLSFPRIFTALRRVSGLFTCPWRC